MCCAPAIPSGWKVRMQRKELTQADRTKPNFRTAVKQAYAGKRKWHVPAQDPVDANVERMAGDRTVRRKEVSRRAF